MFKKKSILNKIRNVDEFKITSVGVIYINHHSVNSVFLFTDAGGEPSWEFHIEEDISNFWIENNKLIFQSSQNEIYVLSIIKREIIDKIMTNGFLKFPFAEGFLVYLPNEKGYTPSYIEGDKKKWQAQDLIDLKFHKNETLIFGFYEFNEWGDSIKSKIGCYQVKSGEKIWHFTLQSIEEVYTKKMEKYGENEMKINHFVGVVNSILWLDVNVANNGSFLLRLDTETGKCVYFLDTVEHQNYLPSEDDFVGLPYTTFTTHDAERNILLGFAPNWLHWQVDLSSSNPTIKMWSLKDEMTKHHAYVSAYMNCGISDSHVFFPVGSLGSTPQVFALNRETLKVDWQYHFTEGGQYFTPTKVEVTDTHLYVLDNTGTLHIFEKEENL